MKEIIQQLQSLGFSQYEAKAYLALLHLGQSTAYQISKESAIPRARIYEILRGLEEQGVVIKEEINESSQYSPLPVEVFLESAKTTWESTYQSLHDTLHTFEKLEPSTDNRVITLKGQQHILTFCKTMLSKAEKKVVVSLWQEMYQRLEHQLNVAKNNATLKGIVFEVNNPFAELDIHRRTSYVDNIGREKWFILSIDGKEMIYGPSIEERETAFYTNDPIHIYLLENYIWHDILVNRLIKKNKEDMESWISEERDNFFQL